MIKYMKLESAEKILLKILKTQKTKENLMIPSFTEFSN